MDEVVNQIKLYVCVCEHVFAGCFMNFPIKDFERMIKGLKDDRGTSECFYL